MKILIALSFLALQACTTIIYTGHKVDLDKLNGFKIHETTTLQVEQTLGRPDNILEHHIDKTTTYTYQWLSDKTVTALPLIRRANTGKVLSVVFKDGRYLGHVVTELNQGIFSPYPTSVNVAGAPVKTSDEFKNPQKVTVSGYDQALMEPFITRDGKYLFFNNDNAPPEKTDLFYAERIDDTHFKFMGEIKGVNNPPPALDGAPTMSRAGDFYYTSSVNYEKTFSMIYTGRFEKGAVTKLRPAEGNFEHKKPGWVMMDVEVAPDNDYIFFSDAYFAKGTIPTTSRLGFARKEKNGFIVPDNAGEILKNLQSNDLQYAPSITSDGLELFFNRLGAKDFKTTILVAKRKTRDEAFGEPAALSAITGFVEGPTITDDGKKLYYHKKEGNGYSIYMVSRP